MDDLKVTDISYTMLSVISRSERDCIGRPLGAVFKEYEECCTLVTDFANSAESYIMFSGEFLGENRSLMIQKIECADGVYILVAARTV